MKGLVSICIPAFKQVQTLKKAIESVLIQSYTNFEIVVSDDTPDDSVKLLIDQLNEPKIRYFKNIKPLGSPENWNNSIKKAKGDYIKILHHDDYFTSKESLQKFVSVLDSNPDIDFVFSYTDVFFKKEKQHFKHKQTSTQLGRLKLEPEFLFFRNIIGAPSAVIFRNDTSIFFNSNFIWLVDVDFYIRYLKQHKNFFCIKETLVTIVDGEEGQITKSVSENKELVLKEHLSLFSQIYKSDLNTKKSRLYFQELFIRFDIRNKEQLMAHYPIPSNLLEFIDKVFYELPKNVWLKKIKKRILTSRYNKQFFKIERF